MWSNEWEYAKNRKLKLALKHLKNKLWGLLLSPDQSLKNMTLCGENRVKECPFRYHYQYFKNYLAYCLVAPHSWRKVKGEYCFILPYCERGYERSRGLRAWERRMRTHREVET